MLISGARRRLELVEQRHWGLCTRDIRQGLWTSCAGVSVVGRRTGAADRGATTDDVQAAVIAAAEAHLRACQLGDLLPRPEDCLPCYLHRALRYTVCNGRLSLTHEWQGHQRVRGRRTGGLTAWLKSRGGFCDCEVLTNVYPDREPDLTPGRGRCAHPAWR